MKCAVHVAHNLAAGCRFQKAIYSARKLIRGCRRVKVLQQDPIDGSETLLASSQVCGTHHLPACHSVARECGGNVAAAVVLAKVEQAVERARLLVAVLANFRGNEQGATKREALDLAVEQRGAGASAAGDSCDRGRCGGGCDLAIVKLLVLEHVDGIVQVPRGRATAAVVARDGHGIKF